MSKRHVPPTGSPIVAARLKPSQVSLHQRHRRQRRFDHAGDQRRLNGQETTKRDSKMVFVDDEAPEWTFDQLNQRKKEATMPA